MVCLSLVNNKETINTNKEESKSYNNQIINSKAKNVSKAPPALLPTTLTLNFVLHLFHYH